MLERSIKKKEESGMHLFIIEPKPTEDSKDDIVDRALGWDIEDKGLVRFLAQISCVTFTKSCNLLCASVSHQ